MRALDSGRHAVGWLRQDAQNDHRPEGYTYLPAKFRRFLQGYEEIGFPLTTRHLGRTLGIFRSESGIQNRTFQFFMYDSTRHRDACRRGMLADPAWAEFVQIDSDALLQQMNTLLLPTSFSPLDEAADFVPQSATVSTTRLFELRSWTTHPEFFDRALALIGEEGVPLMAWHGADVTGWFTSDTGIKHQIYQLRSFADASARDELRSATNEDETLVRFQRNLRALVVEEEAQLLVPMPYSPLR